MKTKLILNTWLLFGNCLIAAEPQKLYFAVESAKEYTRISLTIDGDRVTGTQVWQPYQEHGSQGTIDGIITGGGIIQVVHSYTIEGSEQSEEEILKLGGDQLFIGSGELHEDPKNKTRLNLKEPNKVTFTKALKKIDVTEPKAGTPERKAIMTAMRGPVSAEVGEDVMFIGQVKMIGKWARFSGNVDPANGKDPKNEGTAAAMELDFSALLRKDAEGEWQVLHKGFSGDISVMEESKEKYPKAPWALFE